MRGGYDMPVIDSSECHRLLAQVREDIDLSLGELLFKLQERVGLSGFELAKLADIDAGAFNKIVNGREGRVLHGDQVEALIGELVKRKLLDEGDYTDPQTEGGLWRMALQSAAAADAQIALFMRRLARARPDDLISARREVVKALRKVWTITGGAFPAMPTGYDRAMLAPVTLRLTWAETPRDLDLYLAISSPEETWLVFYRAPGSCERRPWAALDKDVRDGRGPESIVIQELVDAEYHCLVHNCSRDNTLAASHAELSISNPEFTGLFVCPEDGAGDFLVGVLRLSRRAGVRSRECDHERNTDRDATLAKPAATHVSRPKVIFANGLLDRRRLDGPSAGEVRYHGRRTFRLRAKLFSHAFRRTALAQRLPSTQGQANFLLRDPARRRAARPIGGWHAAEPLLGIVGGTLANVERVSI